jgi:hypothetical protein
MDDLDRTRADVLSALVPEHYADFVRAMTAKGYPVASQLAAIRMVEGVRVGSITNGYQMARALGMSRAEAQDNRATSVLLDIAEHLGADAPKPLQEAVRKRFIL